MSCSFILWHNLICFLMAEYAWIGIFFPFSCSLDNKPQWGVPPSNPPLTHTPACQLTSSSTTSMYLLSGLPQGLLCSSSLSTPILMAFPAIHPTIKVLTFTTHVWTALMDISFDSFTSDDLSDATCCGWICTLHSHVPLSGCIYQRWTPRSRLLTFPPLSNIWVKQVK